MFGGADAVVEISRCFWWAWPLHVFGRLPLVMALLRFAYGWIARHRGCKSGSCEAATRRTDDFELRHHRAIGFLPLLILPFVTLILALRLPAWVFMWAVAFALFAGCKWLTFWEAKRRRVSATWMRELGYLLAWPGMDAATFLRENNTSAKPTITEWAFAAIKVFFGLTVTWLIARKAQAANPLLAGWVGMIGLVFLLHCGLFHLLSLGWRSIGANAKPIMCFPILACSLSEFWGQRWNTAFHELVHRFTFQPLRRVTGVTVATLFVFLLSGLVHELVISLPARGGYGLPTAYFAVQGLGVLAGHTALGRRIGLGRGLSGWLFTLVIVAGPAFWLFHPPFIENVILPMLESIGATWNTP